LSGHDLVSKLKKYESLQTFYENEINDKNTNFIIAASFTKAQ
jgi:hypothetical protein